MRYLFWSDKRFLNPEDVAELMLDTLVRWFYKTDTDLVVNAKSYEYMAEEQIFWQDAKHYLRKARRLYSKLQEDKARHLTQHGYFTMGLRFVFSRPRDVIEQFDYVKDIFKKWGSGPDLYKLARAVEDAAESMATDLGVLRLLELAISIYSELGALGDVGRLSRQSASIGEAMPHPVSQARFFAFAARGFRLAGEDEQAKGLESRVKLACYMLPNQKLLTKSG